MCHSLCTLEFVPHRPLYDLFVDWVKEGAEETFKTGNMKTGMTKKFFSLLAPHKSVMLQAVFGALIYSILGLSKMEDFPTKHPHPNCT